MTEPSTQDHAVVRTQSDGTRIFYFTTLMSRYAADRLVENLNGSEPKQFEVVSVVPVNPTEED